MRLSFFPIPLILALASPVFAQTSDDTTGELLVENQEERLTETEIAELEAIEEDSDGSLDDATNSIAAASTREGIGLRADVRIGFAESEIDNRDGSDQSDDTLRARWRVRADIGLTRYFRAAVRLAGICSSEECSPNPDIYNSLPTASSIADGDITLDEMYFQLVQFKRFDLALGRMQTKFVARGGVFAKSLDRNDSNATNVNWTDGLHATFQSHNGWEPHLILQYNSPDGASNVRRTPLNFEDSSARVSYFFGFENLERKNLILQRALDVSYLPKSLLKDGELSGRREDYYGMVLRSASRWPKRDDGPRMRLAGEIGWVPVGCYHRNFDRTNL